MTYLDILFVFPVDGLAKLRQVMVLNWDEKSNVTQLIKSSIYLLTC